MEAALNSEMIGRVERSAADRLAEELDRARKVLPDATSKMKMAVPWVGIVDAIDELKPDLVVVGTHGRRGLSHVLLGSVAERIVRLSAVPVLTVRANDA
jgi:nucleotide-binding universal stress UspA family protein